MKIFNFKNKLFAKLIISAVITTIAFPNAGAMISDKPSSEALPYSIVCCNQYLLRAARNGLVREVKFAIQNGATDRARALCTAVIYKRGNVVDFLLPWYKTHRNDEEALLITADEFGVREKIGLLVMRDRVIDPNSILVSPR